MIPKCFQGSETWGLGIPSWEIKYLHDLSTLATDSQQALMEDRGPEGTADRFPTNFLFKIQIH